MEFVGPTPVDPNDLAVVSQTGGGLVTLYRYWKTHGEENGGLNAGTFEFSQGNGSVGSATRGIGEPLPIGNGQPWELIWRSTQVDTFNVGASFTSELHNLGLGADATNSTGVIHTQTFAQSGLAMIKLATPIGGIVPGSVIAFKTGTVTGTVTDVRVHAGFRQPYATVQGTLL